MSSKSDEAPRATGGCLCGAVQYEVRGPLRDVIKCHCSKCRCTHGHIAAYASTRREDLVLKKDRGLKWFRSVTDETPNVHRGFCQERGASLFWDPRDSDHIYVSTGTLDAPTGLKTVGHVWTSQGGDYYEITDNLPAFEESSQGQLFGMKA